jgi:hypothetical protein
VRTSPPAGGATGTRVDVPVPDGLTPDQAADAQAAIAAYTGFAVFDDQAWQNPQRDWSGEITRWAAGTLEKNFLSDMSLAKKRKIRTKGTGSIVGAITKIQAGTVTVAICADSSHIDTLGADGKSIKAPNQPGTFWRSPGTIKVSKFQTADPTHAWLVTSMVIDHQKSC